MQSITYYFYSPLFPLQLDVVYLIHLPDVLFLEKGLLRSDVLFFFHPTNYLEVVILLAFAFMIPNLKELMSKGSWLKK